MPWAGIQALSTDLSMIQFRMLNKSKGPAMWSPRSQNDRMLFSTKMEANAGTHAQRGLLPGYGKRTPGKRGKLCSGVVTGLGHEIESKAVVLTNGTFLNGIIHIGEKNFGGGRVAEKPATGLTEQLGELGFESDRLKTGTPPRVDGRSLDYTKMEEQPGDEEITVDSPYLVLPKSLKKQKSAGSPTQMKKYMIF